jgi:hypothetical protein
MGYYSKIREYKLFTKPANYKIHSTVLDNDQLDALFLNDTRHKKECIKLVIIQNCIKMHGQENIQNTAQCLVLHFAS